MSDKVKLLHRATQALYLELPKSVAEDFTDIQQAAIEHLEDEIEAQRTVGEALLEHNDALEAEIERLRKVESLQADVVHGVRCLLDDWDNDRMDTGSIGYIEQALKALNHDQD